METLNRKLRIGVFGGARGRTMIDVLLNHPDAELVAVCDKFTPLLDSAKEAAAENGMDIAVYETFEEFIRHDMDAVVLANYATERRVIDFETLLSICNTNQQHWIQDTYSADEKTSVIANIDKQIEKHKHHEFVCNYYKKRREQFTK